MAAGHLTRWVLVEFVCVILAGPQLRRNANFDEGGGLVEDHQGIATRAKAPEDVPFRASRTFSPTMDETRPTATPFWPPGAAR